MQTPKTRTLAEIISGGATAGLEVDPRVRHNRVAYTRGNGKLCVSLTLAAELEAATPAEARTIAAEVVVHALPPVVPGKPKKPVRRAAP